MMLPEPKEFIATLIAFLQDKGELALSELLVGSYCAFQFVGYDGNSDEAYSIHLSLPTKYFAKLDEATRNKLKIYSREILGLPSIQINAFYFSPVYSSAKQQENINSSNELIRPHLIWGLPSNDPQYQCDIFMAMPFAENLHNLYGDKILPLASRLGFKIKRGDKVHTAKDIMFDVWSMINACRLVIVDCTGRNANVFYELGIADALGKPVILIAQSKDDLPFDIIGRRTLIYSMNFDKIGKFEEELTLAINNILLPLG